MAPKNKSNLKVTLIMTSGDISWSLNVKQSPLNPKGQGCKDNRKAIESKHKEQAVTSSQGSP